MSVVPFTLVVVEATTVAVPVEFAAEVEVEIENMPTEETVVDLELLRLELGVPVARNTAKDVVPLA